MRRDDLTDLTAFMAVADTRSFTRAAGRLVRERWCPRFPGYNIYYPGRRQVPQALAALVAALRVGAR